MANKRRVGSRFAEHPLNLTDAERIALAAYVHEAIDRGHDSTSPSAVARVKRLKQFIARLNGDEQPRRLHVGRDRRQADHA
jgi:hypothetical protein